MLLQPCSAFDMGDLRVLATARRTRVRLRVAVQRKSPHLKSVRSASGSNLRRTCHAVGVRRVAESMLTACEAKLTFFAFWSSNSASPLLAGLVRSRSRSSLSRSRSYSALFASQYFVSRISRDARKSFLPRLARALRRLSANRARSSHSTRCGLKPVPLLITILPLYSLLHFLSWHIFLSQEKYF